MELNQLNQIVKLLIMCKKCGKKILITEIHRTTVCPDCGADLHTCINCRHYSPGSHYDCHETIDELVKDKERSNFCDYFSLNAEVTGSVSADKVSAARDAFASLFGN